MDRLDFCKQLAELQPFLKEVDFKLHVDKARKGTSDSRNKLIPPEKYNKESVWVYFLTPTELG